jgi:putative transposase
VEILSLLKDINSKRCRKSKACETLGITLRSVQNWHKEGIKDKRKGSIKETSNKLSHEEEEKIIKTVCNNRFKDLTPYEIVPILAEEGIYLGSESTIYRILRKKGLLRHRNNQRRRRKGNNNIELKATRANQIWSWDITYLKTDVRGKFYYLYLFMDIWSRAIMGWEIHEIESGKLSSAMMKRICQKQGIKKHILLLHSDNGGPMKNSTMLATLQNLGVTESYSRPSVSNDNAYSESLFKTLKYTAGYPKCFLNIESSIRWMTEFERWYNTKHRHSKIGYVTPYQRHYGKDKSILEKRNNVYEEARNKNPGRWSRHCKKLYWQNDVYLKKGNSKKKIA